MESLADGRRLVAGSFPPARFEPRNPDAWARAARLFDRIAPLLRELQDPEGL